MFYRSPETAMVRTKYGGETLELGINIYATKNIAILVMVGVVVLKKKEQRENDG